MQFHTRFLLLVALFAPLTTNAMKPMSDEEIRDLIVQGSIKNYEEGQECAPEQQVRKQEPVRVTEGDTNATSESTAAINPYVCECACPYSKDLKGNKCGHNSAYFSDASTKPKCYREDVQDFEVNDFRSEHTIPDPNKPHPEQK